MHMIYAAANLQQLPRSILAFHQALNQDGLQSTVREQIGHDYETMSLAMHLNDDSIDEIWLIDSFCQ